METEKDRTNREEKLDRYFKAVEEVRTNGNLSREEKLKGLLEPIVELYDEGVFSHGQQHHFAREDCIDLEQELDLSSLELTSDAWEVTPKLNLAEFGLDTDDEIISVDYEKFLPGLENADPQRDLLEVTSIRQLHKIWLPRLNVERIASKDLLDQILVCYTIKRAQNGNEAAFKKLFALYEGRAESKQTHTYVMKMLTWRAKKGVPSSEDELSFDHTPEFLRNPVSYDDDFRQQSKDYLAFIISGVSPKAILRTLASGEKASVFRLPGDVADILIYHFGTYVPGMAEKYCLFVESVGRSADDRTNQRKLMDMIESMLNVLEYLPNDITKLRERLSGVFKYRDEPMMRGAEVARLVASSLPVAVNILGAITPFVDTAFDPFTPLNSTIQLTKDSEKERIMQILSSCYRPRRMGPKNNLTIWLFGGEGKSYVLGKVYQMLGDYYAKKPKRTPTLTLPDIDAVQGDSVDGEPSEDEGRIEESDLPRQDVAKFIARKQKPRASAREVIEESVTGEEDPLVSAQEGPEESVTGEEALRALAREVTEESVTGEEALWALAKKAKIANEDVQFLLNHHSGSTHKELSKRYSLTMNQVRYKIKSLMRALQQATKQS